MKNLHSREDRDGIYLFHQGMIHCETDKEGRITYTNHRFALMSGYEKEELMGKPCVKLLLATIPKTVLDRATQRVVAGKVWEGLLRFSRKDGRYFWADTQIAPLLKKEVLNGFAYIGRPADPAEIRERELEFKRLIMEEKARNY
jgi:aerotaxis receptor